MIGQDEPNPGLCSWLAIRVSTEDGAFLPARAVTRNVPQEMYVIFAYTKSFTKQMK